MPRTRIDSSVTAAKEIRIPRSGQINASLTTLRSARPTTTSSLLTLQNPGRDYQALDFAGAFVDFGDARVAVVTLDGIFAAVAVAAVDLDGFVGDARGHFAGEKFGDGGVD